jgi:LmbE family N-acetylglucosaminyl deacetylase
MRTFVLAFFLMLLGLSGLGRSFAASSIAPPHLDTVLIILAHPDDEVFIRSTIARLIENGNEVDAIYLTAGEGGTDRHWNDTPEYNLSAKEQTAHQNSLRATRTAEVARAAKQYGFRHHYVLGVRDEPLRDPITHIPVRNPEPFLKIGGPWDGEKIRNQIAETLKPDLVITFYPSQPTTHAHHQATAKIVEQMRKDHLLGKQLKAAFGFYESDVVLHHDSLHYPLSEKRIEVSPLWISDHAGPNHGVAYGKIGTVGALEHDSQLKGDTNTLIREWDKNPAEVLAPLTSKDSIEALKAALRLP